MKISIVGVGKVGGALAIALNDASFEVGPLIARSRKSAKGKRSEIILNRKVEDWDSIKSIESDVIVVSTADTDIPMAVEQLARFVRSGQIVLHTSGALTSGELTSLKALGCETGSIHPLTSISDPTSGAHQFAGTYFCVEGSRKAVSYARQIVKSLEGNSFTVKSSKKALYHAAAVMAAGHSTALFDCSLEMLQECGIERQTGTKILLPLVKSTIANLEKRPPEKAITGTFARLDQSTFDKHIEALKSVSPEILFIYLLLGERSLDIIERKGHDADRLEKLRRSISIAKESLR